MTAVGRRIPEGMIDPLLLDVYPGPSRSSFTFREDEGLTELGLQPVKGGFILSWRGPIERGHRLRLRPGWRIGSVEIAGGRRGLLPATGKKTGGLPSRGWVSLPRSREGRALVRTA